MTARPPTTAAAIGVIATLTLGRLRRSRSFLIGGIIAVMPVVFAVVAASSASDHEAVRGLLLLAAQALVAVLPALFVASSIGEDIEDKTIVYLWSRPLARWTVLAGKLAALTPIAIALVVGCWIASSVLGLHEAPSAASLAALVVGTVTSTLMVAAIALLAPRHGMALAIAYMMLVDGAIGALPTSLAMISISHHVRVISDIGEGGGTIAGSLLALAVIGALCTAVATWRIRRLEA